VEKNTPTYNMLLQQTALVPLPTFVEGWYISSRNKITKGGLRQAQDRYGSAANTPTRLKPTHENTTEPGPAENPEKRLKAAKET